MTTSGTTTFSVSRDDVIKAAMRKLGILGQGQVPTAQDISDSSQALNLMVKSWAAEGLNLWTRREGVLIPAANQQKYLLGLTSTDYVCDADNLVSTTFASTATAATSTIFVTNATGIVAGQQLAANISATQNAFCLVTSVNSTTGAVGLSTPLPATGTAGNPVLVFPTTKIPRPVDVPDARRRSFTGPIDVPIIANNREQYMALPNKNATGKIVQFYYDPQLGNGALYVWPTADDVKDQVRFTYHRPIYDFNGIANTPDYPQEWFAALVFNLAVEIAPEYGLTPDNMVMMRATKLLNDLMGLDTDISIFIQPSLRTRRA